MDQRRQFVRAFEDRFAVRHDDRYSYDSHANRLHNINRFQRRNVLHRQQRHQQDEHSFLERSRAEPEPQYMYMSSRRNVVKTTVGLSGYPQYRKRSHDSSYDKQDCGRKRLCTVVHNTSSTSLTNQGHHAQETDLRIKVVNNSQTPSGCQQSQASTDLQHQTPASGMKQFQPKMPVNGTITDTLPYPAEGVEVVYTVNTDIAESWLKTSVIEPAVNQIGFDIEWKPQFVPKKKGGKENKTAVVQLSVKTSCLVLHIFRMTSLPPSLCIVLSDKRIIKVGSGIDGDVTKLLNDTGIFCNGRVDTQECARAVGLYQRVGLKHLSKQVLNIDLNKPKSVSMSNWECFPLKKNQIQYAALDAWISLKLYLKLREKLDPKNDIVVFSSHVVVHYGDQSLRKKKGETSKLKNIFKDMKPKECKEPGSSTSPSVNSQEASSTVTSYSASSVTVSKLDSDKTSQSTGTDSSSSIKHSTTTSPQTSNVTSSLITSNIASNATSDVSTSQHLIDSEFMLNYSTPPQQYMCPVEQCYEKKFKTERAVQLHIKSKHVSCKICGKVYRSKISAKHKKLHAKQLC